MSTEPTPYLQTTLGNIVRELRHEATVVGRHLSTHAANVMRDAAERIEELEAEVANLNGTVERMPDPPPPMVIGGLNRYLQLENTRLRDRMAQLETASKALVDACDKNLTSGGYHAVELQVDALWRLLGKKSKLLEGLNNG